MKRFWLATALLAATVPGIVLLPSAAYRAVASPARGPIAVQSIQFYEGQHFHHNPCTPAGSPARHFHSSVKRVYTYVVYSVWNGRHKDQYRWYAPNGKLYTHDKASPYTGQGPTTDCNWLAIKGFPAAHMLGRWTFRLVVDGHQAKTAHFRLVK